MGLFSPDENGWVKARYTFECRRNKCFQKHCTMVVDDFTLDDVHDPSTWPTGCPFNNDIHAYWKLTGVDE